MYKNLLIYRLLNGYYYLNIGDKKFKIISPSLKTIYNSELYINNLLDNIRFQEDSDEWLHETRRLIILNHFNIWNPSKEEELNSLIKDLDKLRLNIYLNFFNKQVKELLHSKLKEAYNRINILHNTKYTFYEFTKEYYISMMKNKYILKHTVYLNNRKFLHKNKNSYYWTNILFDETQKSSISHKEIKELICTDEWKNYWDSSKGRIFNKPTALLDHDQRLALNIATMYDSIRKHPECPPEEIFQDAEAIDGWILHQNEKYRKEKRKQEIENRLSNKNKNAGEIFVMTNSVEESKEIYDLNDPVQLQKIRKIQEFAMRNPTEEIKWQDIPIVKQDIINQHRMKK